MDAVAQRPSSQVCPLCGQPVASGDGLEALGKHFERCPKTDRSGHGKARPAKE